MKTVAVQMCSGPDIEKNLQQADQLLASAGQADVIVLPECFAWFGGDLREFETHAGQVRNWMSQLAQNKQAWLVGGSIPFVNSVDENPRASCFVYSPEGVEVSRYDKIHLFDVDVADQTRSYRESSDYSAGDQVKVVDAGSAKIGLSICYDLRFPELFRRLRSERANLIAVPSAFTRVTGEAHWEVLLRARAIENQCFILAANQSGIHAGQRETWGHSMIISPWGEVLAEAKREPCVISADIDLGMVSKIRRNMPCFNHRKLK